MVRVISAALDVPENPAHQDDVCRHIVGVPVGLRRVALDDPDPLGHSRTGGGRPVPGEGDEGGIELDQQRRGLRTPWMGRHHVDHVTPLARTQAHHPDRLWMGSGTRDLVERGAHHRLHRRQPLRQSRGGVLVGRMPAHPVRSFSMVPKPHDRPS